MFARNLTGFSLACLLAASTPLHAMQEHEPLPAADTETSAPAAEPVAVPAPQPDIVPDKLIADDSLATSTEPAVDADS